LSHVKLPELLKSLAPHGPARASRPIKPLVMKNHDVPIAGHLAIHLDHVDTGFDGLLKSQTSILREVAGGAAVGYFEESSHESSALGIANPVKDLESLTKDLVRL
jgi:hypothetical protein